MRALRSLLPFLLMAPLLTAAKCDDKTPPEDPDTVTDGLVNKAEVELQLISIDPDRVDPNNTFNATLYGAGMVRGARVWIGDTELQRVAVSDENTASISGPALAPGRYNVKIRNPNGDEATLRGGLRVEAATTNASECGMIRISFAYDSSSLDGEAQRALNAKLSCFQSASATVRVEGHCDERGTTEYNLALGSRRANAVERWLTSQGVPPSRVRSVSYGEERPLDQGHNDAAWAKNRRADITVTE